MEPLLRRHRHHHHERKIRSQFGRLGITDIATGIYDHARNIRNNAQTILADGINDQVRVAVMWKCRKQARLRAQK